MYVHRHSSALTDQLNNLDTTCNLTIIIIHKFIMRQFHGRTCVCTKVVHEKAVLSRCVFSLDLKVASDRLEWMLAGREFHTAGDVK